MLSILLMSTMVSRIFLWELKRSFPFTSISAKPKTMKKILFLLGFVPMLACAQLFTGRSEMRDIIEQYKADVASLNRKYAVKESNEYYSRFSQLYDEWLKNLKNVPFEKMGQDGKVDYVLLRTRIERDANT